MKGSDVTSMGNVNSYPQASSDSSREFKKSEYWFNPGVFAENPETGQEDFVEITGMGVALDNLQGKEVCDDGSWFTTKILAGNQYMEDIRAQAKKLEPKQQKVVRFGNSPFGYRLTRCGTKTAVAGNIANNMAYNKTLFG